MVEHTAENRGVAGSIPALAILRTFAFVALLTLACAACGGTDSIQVSDGDETLTSLLNDHGVEPGRQPVADDSLENAWSAFKDFAAVPVDQSELDGVQQRDVLLFEFALTDLSEKRDAGFELTFTRQLLTADGDIQQVHLVAHYDHDAFRALRDHVKLTGCASTSCAWRCNDTRHLSVVPVPCSVSVAAGPTTEADVVLGSAGLWSDDAGGTSTDAQRASWIDLVESSPAFRLAKTLKPLSYEVSQGSAE